MELTAWIALAAMAITLERRWDCAKYSQVLAVVGKGYFRVAKSHIEFALAMIHCLPAVFGVAMVPQDDSRRLPAPHLTQS